jgi:hypothetical protein
LRTFPKEREKGGFLADPFFALEHSRHFMELRVDLPWGNGRRASSKNLGALAGALFGIASLVRLQRDTQAR